MQVHKRRPTSSKTTQKCKTEAGLTLSTFKKTISVTEHINKKYYYPALHQQEKHQAFLISKFLSGFHGKDEMQIGQLTRLYNQQEWLCTFNASPQQMLRYTITSTLSEKESHNIFMINHLLIHYFSFSYYLLLQNQRRKKQYLLKKSFSKRQSQKSTEITSKNKINVLENVTEFQEKNNESIELNKLSKCLKNVLRKYDSKKDYKAFLDKMEMKKEKPQQKSQGMLKLILNLQNDFSSIHIDNPNQGDESKQSLYGLSQLKKKSQRNPSKMQLNKCIDKKINFQLFKLNFTKKPKQINEKSNKCISHSKNSRKSLSHNKKDQNNIQNTPQNHKNKSKSKSTKKLTLKQTTDKKSKLIDTQRLYYDDISQKCGQKQDSKPSLLKHVSLKSDNDTVKSKKRLTKR